MAIIKNSGTCFLQYLSFSILAGASSWIVEGAKLLSFPRYQEELKHCQQSITSLEIFFLGQVPGTLLVVQLQHYSRLPIQRQHLSLLPLQNHPQFECHLHTDRNRFLMKLILAVKTLLNEQ